jgi:Flp pilus assembly protein TadD
MAPEIVLQLALLALTLAIFIAIHKHPREALTKLRTRHRATLQSNRHFAHGSQLLAQARSTAHTAQSLAHAKSALIEAQKALSLSPKDPEPLVLKALALDLMGHKSSALRSLDLALSSPRVRSLAERERGDALVKRAELKLSTNRRRRVDSAVEDLVEAVRLGGSTKATAFCLLGECYEWKGIREEAKNAFEEALRVEPGSVAARQGLDRLGP